MYAVQIPYRSHPLAGDPRDKLVELATKLNAQLIVCGTRGMGLVSRYAAPRLPKDAHRHRRVFGRTLVGSVSEHLLNHAPSPVLVVR